MHNHVITEIVNNDLCIGCGVCIGTCPSKLLEPMIRSNGDLAPKITSESCPTKCRVCLDTCPFESGLKNESDFGLELFSSVKSVSHDPVLGYYNKLFAGHSKTENHRATGSSGGIATYILEKLLVTNKVDAIVCVGPGTSVERLFEFKIVDDVESLRSMSGSRYYPVEIGTVLGEIIKKSENRRFAITGLPCTIKAIRLAMGKYPKLKDKIVFTLGLVCGHLPNKNYTEYLAANSGVEPRNLISADYRIKEGTTSAIDYSFQALTNKTIGKKLPFTKSVVGKAYCNGYFQFNACNYCDDIFAETADLTVLDAWLPKYIQDTRGTSFVVSRSSVALELLENAIVNNECALENVTAKEVLQSQDGVIHQKRALLRGRLFQATIFGKKIPQKRVSPSLLAWLFGAYEILVRRTIQKVSKSMWNRGGRQQLRKINCILSFLVILLIPVKCVYLTILALKNPNRVIKKIKRVVAKQK